ncbi:MAG: hypothetical protein ACI9VM_000671 [Candidatus Azotimanducaceae bacterium]|jgi:hypothetical protein
MEVRDWVTLITTFIVAALSGMYFYVTTFKPVYVEQSGDTDTAFSTELNIIGVTYGGFVPQDYIHPTYRISANGSYDYFAGGTTQTENIEGKLPKDLFKAIKGAIATADLEALARPVSDKNCASYADGIEYEYNITVDGVSYVLDTCKTAFENRTELGRALLEVWTFAYEPTEYRFSIANFPSAESDDFPSLRGYFEDGFKEAGFEE